MSTKVVKLERARVGQEHATAGTGRQIREAACLTLEDIAERCGVHCGSISKWERGLQIPSKRNAARWADVLEEVSQELAAI